MLAFTSCIHDNVALLVALTRIRSKQIDHLDRNRLTRPMTTAIEPKIYGSPEICVYVCCDNQLEHTPGLKPHRTERDRDIEIRKQQQTIHIYLNQP